MVCTKQCGHRWADVCIIQQNQENVMTDWKHGGAGSRMAPRFLTWVVSGDI